MKNLLVRNQRTEISAAFRLSPMIAKWEAAKEVFISTISSEFADTLFVHPEDFSNSILTDPANCWCSYRIYGGANTITLRSAVLEFSIKNLHDTDNLLLAEMLHKMRISLLQSLRCYHRQSYHIISNQHVEAVNGNCQSYLAKFYNTEMAEKLNAESVLKYQPSTRLNLKNDDGTRAMSVSVEQSEILPNGLFFSTSVFVSTPNLTDFSDEQNWLTQMSEIVNNVLGISYEGS